MRRLLVAVWHVLAHNEVDIHADATHVAKSLFKHAYDVGVKNLPDGQSALQFTRNQWVGWASAGQQVVPVADLAAGGDADNDVSGMKLLRCSG